MTISRYIYRAFGIVGVELAFVAILSILIEGGGALIVFLMVGGFAQMFYKSPALITCALGGQRQWLISMLISRGLVGSINVVFSI